MEVRQPNAGALDALSKLIKPLGLSLNDAGAVSRSSARIRCSQVWCD